MSTARKSALKRSSPKTRKNKRVSIHESQNEIFRLSPSPKRLSFKAKSTDPTNMINISKSKSSIILPVAAVAASATASSAPKTFSGRIMSLFTRKRRGGGRRRGGMFFRKRRVGFATKKRSKTPKSPKNSLDCPAKLEVKEKSRTLKGYADATSGRDFVDGEWKVATPK